MTNTRVLLGVNIDHVATLRQARGTRYPAYRGGGDQCDLHSYRPAGQGATDQ